MSIYVKIKRQAGEDDLDSEIRAGKRFKHPEAPWFLTEANFAISPYFYPGAPLGLVVCITLDGRFGVPNVPLLPVCLLEGATKVNRVGRRGWFAARTTPCPPLPLIEPDGRISRIRLSEAVLWFAS